MRCSECSRLIKPVVAIDIDGTLADYHGHFINFAKSYLGISDPLAPFELGYEGQMSFKKWGCEEWGIDEHIWGDIKLAYRQGAQKRSAPVYPYAADLTAVCREMHAEVWLTTTRPYLRLDGIDPDTRFWLHRNEIEYDGLVYADNKYEALAERVDPGRVCMILEDLPEQYDLAADWFGERVVILRKNDYNTAVSRPAEVLQLLQAAEAAKSRIQRWKELHDEDRTRARSV
jgi:hypothetical protein